MTYVVGYGPHNDDRSAIELACQLAASRPEPVRAVSVVPKGWGTPIVGDSDREFEAWAAGEGQASAECAAADLAQHPDVDGTAVWVAGRSVPQTLLEQARAHDARMLVVGSSDDAAHGRIRLSSKTDRLLHSSTIPVAIAPRGYRSSSALSRITVGFRDDDASWSLLTRVAEIAQEGGTRMRVVTFLINPSSRPVTSAVSHAQTQVIDLWNLQAATAQNEAANHLKTLGVADRDVEFVIASGYDWESAVSSLEWTAGDVLVVGSSSTHRLAQVFIGSSATKILRVSPVPVIVVPGSAVKD